MQAPPQLQLAVYSLKPNFATTRAACRAITEQQTGKGVSLSGVRTGWIRGGDVLREVEEAGGIVRLVEIVEELALLETEFERVRAFDPGQ